MQAPPTIEMWTIGVAAPQVAARTAARAEAAGWDGMLVVDSQNLAGDPYVGLTLAAAATERLRLGPGVTNPATRHPAATAAAIASVHVASAGRAVLGIGRGDSALAHLGAAPVPAELLGHYVRVVRAFLRGEEVAFADLLQYMPDSVRPVESLGLADAPTASKLSWLPRDLAPVPVEVAATGPRVLALAALHADRVMLAVGADPARVSWAIAHVRAVRERAGLDPLTQPIGAYVNAVCHPEIDVGRTLIAGGLATFARFSVMDGAVRTPVDTAQRAVLTNLHSAYDMTHHTEVGSAQTSRLTTEFIDRFGIVGAPDACVARFRELAELGVDRFVVSGPTMGADREQAQTAARHFADHVIPALHTSAAS
jgi:5,10-methylenetetrahydromethanopterin reductase